jgi:hypothetical protein
VTFFGRLPQSLDLVRGKRARFTGGQPAEGDGAVAVAVNPLDGDSVVGEETPDLPVLPFLEGKCDASRRMTVVPRDAIPHPFNGHPRTECRQNVIGYGLGGLDHVLPLDGGAGMHQRLRKISVVCKQKQTA